MLSVGCSAPSPGSRASGGTSRRANPPPPQRAGDDTPEPHPPAPPPPGYRGVGATPRGVRPSPIVTPASGVVGVQPPGYRGQHIALLPPQPLPYHHPSLLPPGGCSRRPPGDAAVALRRRAAPRPGRAGRLQPVRIALPLRPPKAGMSNECMSQPPEAEGLTLAHSLITHSPTQPPRYGPAPCGEMRAMISIAPMARKRRRMRTSTALVEAWLRGTDGAHAMRLSR